MRNHKLIIQRGFADAIHDGRKTFEVRSLEHEIAVGDVLTFTVVDLDGRFVEHPLANEPHEVTYELTGWGIEDGYGCYGIRPLLTAPRYLQFAEGEEDDLLRLMAEAELDPAPLPMLEAAL